MSGIAPNNRRRGAAENPISPSVLYSAEAEKAVLGCMMAQPAEVIDEVIGVLNKEDFFVPAHQEIFEALDGMWANKVAIDVMTIDNWLKDRKLAEAVGSPGILAELLVGFATHLNVGSYITIVKDKAMLRALQQACSTIVQDIIDMPDSVPGVLDRAESLIFRVTSLKESSPIHDATACVALFEQEQEKIQQGIVETRLKTGIRAIDEGNDGRGGSGGFPIPGLVVIGGEPGVGKTAVAGTLLDNWCAAGIGVGMFSLEMTKQQLVKRQVSRLASIDSRLLNKKLHEAYQMRVASATATIKTWPFWIDQTTNLTPVDLRSKSRQLVNKGARVIILDYLQLMRGSNRKDERREQIAEITRTAKLLANELGILFVMLSQLNREGRKRGNLCMADLKESSTIEEDADAVLLLERKEGYENCPNTAIPVLGRWGKFRDDAVGDIELTFNAPQLRYS